MSRLVDMVVTPGLEEEMPGLARGHRDQPADQRGRQRIEKHHRVTNQETERADKVQALVDAAVVIVAVIIPTLDAQLLPEILDHALPQKSRLIRFTRIRCRRYDIIKMSYDITRMTQAGELQPPCSGGDRHSSFADTDQREVAERRYQA